MKKTFTIVGNWKMNSLYNENIERLTTLLNMTKDIPPSLSAILAPPALFLHHACQNTPSSSFSIAAQDCSIFEENGAFTGEVSAKMLYDIGCSHIIIGHSERRTYFNESPSTLKKKIDSALKAKLIPIFCIGEDLAQRDAHKTFEVLRQQIEDCYPLNAHFDTPLAIAYEPVWAIGTGNIPTYEEIENVHRFIYTTLEDLFSLSYAKSIPLLYGGSVTKDNAKAISQLQNVQGLLIGGASLSSEHFHKIINIVISS